jgi:hypothetical protein
MYKKRINETLKYIHASSRTPFLEYFTRAKAQPRTRSNLKSSIFANHKMWGRHISSFLGRKHNICYNIEDFINHTVFEIINVRDKTVRGYTLNEIVFEEEQPNYEPDVDFEEGEFVVADPIIALKFNGFNLALKIRENGDIIKYGLFTRLVDDNGIDFRNSDILWEQNIDWIVQYSAARGKIRSKKRK